MSIDNAPSSNAAPAEAISSSTAARRRTVDALPSWAAFLGGPGMAKIAVLAALMIWLYWAHFVRLYTLWKEPDWSHGFLLPFFALYILNTKKRELMEAEHRGSIWGWVLIAGSLYIFIWSISAKIGYPQSLSIVSVIAGLVLLLCGWRTFQLSLFPIAFLVLTIPPPDRLYREITQPMQQGAAAVATAVLNMFPGAEVERNGINIWFFMDTGHNGTFTVAGACSGMRSLMAFVALGLATAYFAPRPTWQRLFMAAVTVPVALFCNVLRVIITGSFQMYERGDLASGTPHSLLGFLMFGIGFGIYALLLWVLDHLFVADSESATEAGAGA
ncbi:Transmembrane exosortase (Exosortase_EpsH) [Phycisphaerae bacterium RAS2]|nr:Transmembrane exosortase (Exosortase_EpsH) [Phycisphaerae bacterium RAS2]